MQAFLGSALAMNKRDKFIAELREEARRKGLSFRAEKWRGKGGHMMVFVGARLTTVPSRDIDPKTARKVAGALMPDTRGDLKCDPTSIERNSNAGRVAALW